MDDVCVNLDANFNQNKKNHIIKAFRTATSLKNCPQPLRTSVSDIVRIQFFGIYKSNRKSKGAALDIRLVIRVNQKKDKKCFRSCHHDRS